MGKIDVFYELVQRINQLERRLDSLEEGIRTLNDFEQETREVVNQIIKSSTADQK